MSLISKKKVYAKAVLKTLEAPDEPFFVEIASI